MVPTAQYAVGIPGIKQGWVQPGDTCPSNTVVADVAWKAVQKFANGVMLRKEDAKRECQAQLGGQSHE